MKRLLIFIEIILLSSALFIPATSLAQAQINTKKVKISDFTSKTTRVVTAGNPFYDSALKEEISARWRISPFEFCSLEEFEQTKCSEDYYFLLVTKGQFKKESEPGIQFLTLVKGGKDAEKGIDQMLEIVSMPFAAADSPSGRELVVLPVCLDIIQNYTLDSMDKDINAYSGLANYTLNLSKSSNFDVVVSESDLSAEVNEDFRQEMVRSGLIFMDEDDVDEMIMDQKPGTIASYTVAPANPQNGSVCYKMLFDTVDHTLYYYRKHKIGKKAGPGFLKDDLKRISGAR